MRGRIHLDLVSVGSAKLLNGFASFLIRIVTVRFLDPASYGVLSLGLSSLMLFDAVLGSAVDIAAMGLITKDAAEHGRAILPVEKAAIRLKLLASLALVAFFSLTGEWLGYRFLHGPGGRSFFVVLAAGGACILLLRSTQLYFQARLRFRSFAAIDLLHSGLRVVLIAGLLVAGVTAAVPILGCFAVAPTLVWCGFFLRGKAAAEWSAVRPNWALARTVARATAPILACFAVSSLANRLDVFVLALRGTPTDLGLYGAALTLATVPEIALAYLAPVFLPRILPECKAGTFFQFFKRFHLLVYAVIGAAMLVALVAGDAVLGLFLPARYAPTIGLVKILLPGTLMAASFCPLTVNFLMLTRPRTLLILDGVAAPLLAAAYYYFIPIHGAMAAAWITCAHRLIKTAVLQTSAYLLARRSHAL